MSSNTAAKTPANTTTKTRMMVQIAMLTAVAEVLMLFDFPLPFAPSFYKIDLSEVPILIGCSMVLPAGLIYRYHKTRKNAVLGMAAGTLVMAAIGGLLNAFVLLPAYAALFGGMDAIIGMGTAVNKNITSVQSFVLLSVVPFNLVKGVIVSLVTFLLYKHVSRVLIHNA